MAVTYQKPKDDDTPWDQRLVNYGQNSNAGLDEYKRAMGVYRSKSALGDTAGASAAQKWAGQVDTAIGGIGSRPQSETRNTLETYKANLNKPVTPYTFDINNNQQYQQALQAAQRSAQTAGNNATVALGARGIGNSQQAMTTANQIQQRSVADVNANMLPQIMRDDYLRYRDGISDQEKQNEGLLKYANALDGLDQQDFNNNRLTESDARVKQQDHINLANDLTKTYGVQVDPKDNPYYAYQQIKGLKPLTVREYEDGRSDVAFDQDYKTKTLANTVRNTDALIADRQADNARQSTAATTRATTKTAKEEAVTASGGPKVSTAQFNDAFQTLQKKYGVAKYRTTTDAKGETIYDENAPVTYNNTDNPDQQAKLVIEVLGLGLNDEQTLQMWNKLGITEELAQQLLGG